MEQILQFLEIGNIMLIVVGLVVGIAIGVVPGLGGAVALALLLPITFGMDIGFAITILMAVYVGTVYGGSITSILLNIPGDPTSVATTFDGYPLTRKGDSLSALGASIMSSTIGGIAGVIVLIFFSPIIATFVIYNVDSVSYAWLVLIALTFITQAIKGHISKGVATALLGFMVSTIGLDVLTPRLRYTFDIIHLIEGIPFVPIILGIFAISHLLTLCQEEGSSTISQIGKLSGSLVEGMKEVFKNFGTTIRGILIGLGLGILPGIGGSTINLVAYYSVQKKFDKKGTFGKGDIRGVIAPESSNNASVSAALIPMITLGIPGGAAAAIFMGILILHGLTPGPSLFTRNIDFVYSLFIALAAANILLFPVAVVTLKPFAHISLIKISRLIPIVITFVIFGAFALRGSYFDVIITLIFGLLGYFLYIYNFPVVPFIMAFILGPIFELNVRRALLISDGAFSIFFSRPLHWILAVCFVLIIIGPKLYELIIQKKKEVHEI